MVGVKRTPEQQAQYSNLKELAVNPWHAMPVEKAFELVNSRPSGLTDAEVAASRAKYGPNSTPSPPKPGLFMKILQQLNVSVIYILIGSAVVSGIFEEWPDLALIISVIVLNVFIGIIQEGKAEAAAEALNQMLAARAMVIRNEKQISIEANEIVLGDVLYLQAGDNIVADVRFFSTSNMKIKESALTGESEDVEKNLELCREGAPLGDRKNCGFAGTACTNGQGTGVVIAIGATAQLGSIKTLIDETENTATPLQLQLEVFGRVLSILTIIVAASTFFLAWKARNLALSESFSIAVGVAVAIIPEGLPSVVTITLAIGVRRMAQHNAIIRQLPAVETLGSVSVVCSDKTGTLTVNQMMVTRVRTAQQQFVVDGQGYDPYSGEVQGSQGALRKYEPDLMTQLYWLTLPGIVANDGGLAAPNLMAAMWPSKRNLDTANVAVDVQEQPAEWQIAGDPTDVAVLVLGHKLGIEGNINTFKAQFDQLAKLPFDSDYKFVAVMQDVDTPAGRKRLVYLKGAWDEIIRRCSTQAVNNNAFESAPINTKFWSEEASSYAANGMRVLAVAQWEVPADKTTLTLEEIRDAALASPVLQLNCLLAIVDPCRESAGRAVHECHTAGIVVKMITGDHPDTACYIAKQLGIINEAQFKRYIEIKDDPALDEERKRIVMKSDDIEAIPSDDKESQLAKYVLDTNVFARVSPLHKLRIVRALKETCGKITSMTGDGVNDAPALKEAHCGVAMGITGTDVAKQAAKMILADDLFATIAEAVRRGRGVYDNLRKVLLFALPTNFAQGFSIVAAMIIGMPSPLTAMQVLTVNMVTSVTLGIVIALEEPEADVMRRPPRDPKAPLLDKFIAWRTFFVTLLLVIAMLGNLQWEIVAGSSIDEARAVAMGTLVVAQALYALNCRFVFHSSLTYRVFVGNPWLLAMIIVNIAILIFLIYTPGVQDVWNMDSIGGAQWGKILLLAFAVFFIVEFDKYVGPRFIAPAMAPCLNWIDRRWSSLSCAWPCCTSRLCRTIAPSAAPAMTGMPTPGEESLTAALSPSSRTAPADEIERKRSHMAFATSFRSSRHVKAPPTAPEVTNFITESRRRLIGAQPVYSTTAHSSDGVSASHVHTSVIVTPAPLAAVIETAEIASASPPAKEDLEVITQQQ